MLIQFNFKNFKSFKEENSLDMTAAPIKEHPYNLINDDSTGERYLRVAAIYGANASGKSNLVSALNFMQFFVITSLDIEGFEKFNYDSIPIEYYLFNKKGENTPSEFEVFFKKNNIEYQYGFILDKNKVHEEWLYSKEMGWKSYKPLFIRINNNIKCEKGFEDADKFKESVEDRSLFLSLVAKTKVEKAKEVYLWFFELEIINFGSIAVESYLSKNFPQKIENKTYKNKLEKFLVAIDTGIKGIRLEKSESDERNFKILSKHSIQGSDEFMEIPFKSESSGTQKMLYLYHFILNSLENGIPLIVDELDAKLHTMLVKYIVNMFNSSKLNKNNAQLIYTTHDVSSLRKDLFRRDQVWFVEKDSTGVSSLYSLAEYKIENGSKVRNDAVYGKDYISGRYGAVPFLEEFDILED